MSFLTIAVDYEGIQMSANHEPATGKGFIYILSNNSMPGLLKVGLTENSIRQRIRELSSNTGVPTEFKLEKAFEIDANALFRVEQAIHRELKIAGFHHQKEFFKVSLVQCTYLAEEVIFQVTGVRSPDIVGLAEERLRAKEVRRQWETKELARRESLLREANFKIAQSRENWIVTRKALQSKNEEPWYTSIGNLIFMLIGISALGLVLFEAVGFVIGASLVGITGFWLYQSHKGEVEQKERVLRAEAAKQYPFKSLDDFAKSEYIEERADKERNLGMDNERGVQSRIRAYREEKLSGSNNESAGKCGRSWRLYRNKKLLLHVESNTSFSEGAFWRERNTAVKGYWTNNSRYPFAWDDDIEELW
jgi:T5orf172 domain